MSIFDVIGREVSVLVNEWRNAGSYEVKFDSLGLASGIYVCRLQVGKRVLSKTMHVMK